MGVSPRTLEILRGFVEDTRFQSNAMGILGAYVGELLEDWDRLRTEHNAQEGAPLERDVRIPAPASTRAATERLLRAAIENISESGWCAGWLSDIEHELWEIVQVGVERPYGMYFIYKEDIQTLRWISDQLDGWVDMEQVYTRGEWEIKHIEWLETHSKEPTP